MIGHRCRSLHIWSSFSLNFVIISSNDTEGVQGFFINQPAKLVQRKYHNLSINVDADPSSDKSDDSIRDTAVSSLEKTTNGENSQSLDETSPKSKPMSRLAMAAADWMDEEEDELFSYWERFDESKSNSKQNVASDNMQHLAGVGQSNSNNIITNEQSTENKISTEERLDKYFQSRGIDKSIEKKYAKEIERAITFASASATGAKDAIQSLEKVRPYMQVGSKIGGTALLELAYAYQANGDEEESSKICVLLIDQNPLRELQMRAKLLLEDPEKNGKSYDKKRFWTSFDSWWN